MIAQRICCGLLVNQANQKLKTAPPDPNDLSIFSMDAEALYPSLHIDDIMNGIMEIVASTPINFDHVNIYEMTKYLYIMYSEEELIRHGVDKTIPDRQVDIDCTNRQKPTIAYLDRDYYTKTVNGTKTEDIMTKTVMIRFVTLYKQKLVKLSLSHQIVLLKIYVDVLNHASIRLPNGIRYVKG